MVVVASRRPYRLMSRWWKEGLVLTETDGFGVRNRGALERLASR